MFEKIVSIGKSGMSHLREQAKTPRDREQDQPAPPPFPSDKCFKVRTLLDGKAYFVPGGACGTLTNEPCFPLFIPVAYSEFYPPAAAGAVASDQPIINKHEDMRIWGTGIVMEQINLPKWWAEKDCV